MFINVNGTWKSITDMFVNVAGTWKKITDGFVNVAGTWKRFFSSAVLSIAQQVQIAQSTNSTTSLITLTGTNYHWSPGPAVLTYKFQRSINAGSTWTDIDSGSITDPGFGLSNTKTYLLPSSGPNLGVIANVLNYYRFRVDATYGTMSAESISSSTTVQGPTNITLSLSDPTFNSIGLSWTASTGASRYIVYRSTDNNIFTAVTSAISSTSAGPFTGLTGSNTYYFKVLPITGASVENPGYSGNFSNTLALPILATPILSSSTSTTNGFFFTIDNYDASNSYSLSTTSGSVSRSGNTVTVTGLSAGASAIVTVTATRSGYGNSNSASRSGSASPQYSITWNPNGGIFSNGSSANEIDVGPIGTVTAPSSTPTRSGFTFLYWRDSISGDFLYQVNTGGSWTIGTSGSTNVTFFARWSLNVTTPSAPTNLARSTGSGFSKTFTWSAPTNDGGATITSYQYSVDGGSSWLTTSSNSSQSYTYSVTSATFSVRAVNSAGAGTAASMSFTIPTVNTPTASSITSTSATISWTSSGQSSYSLTGVGPNSPYTGTTATSRNVTGLSAATSYSPVVTVTSSTSDTVTSSAGSFTTSGGVVAPSNVQVTVTSSGLGGAFTPGSVLTATFTASGTTPFSSTSYQWQRSTDDINWSNVGTNSNTLSTNSTYNNRFVRCTVTVTNSAGSASGTSQSYFISDAV